MANGVNKSTIRTINPKFLIIDFLVNFKEVFSGIYSDNPMVKAISSITTR